jgi:hypothetical protein
MYLFSTIDASTAPQWLLVPFIPMGVGIALVPPMFQPR